MYTKEDKITFLSDACISAIKQLPEFWVLA